VLAVEMLLEVEHEFEKEPPLSLLASGLTVARLAAWLETGNADAVDSVAAAVVAAVDEPEEALSPVLVPLRAAGSKPPVFMVHGVGLPSLRGAFVGKLDPDQPIYMFQHRGIDGETPTNETIEDMAADYIAAMRAVRPTGPYLVGGFCAGAIVALEMAHQLTHHGQAAPMIFMVDPPRILHAHVGRGAILWYAERAGAFLWRKLRQPFDWKSRRMWKEWRIRIDEQSAASAAVGSAPRKMTHDGVRKAQESFIRALRKYRPNPYHGIIHFISPLNYEESRKAIEEFWSQSYDDVRVERIGRAHHSIYADDLPLMAAHLQRCLDEVEA